MFLKIQIINTYIRITRSYYFTPLCQHQLVGLNSIKDHYERKDMPGYRFLSTIPLGVQFCAAVKNEQCMETACWLPEIGASAGR